MKISEKGIELIISFEGFSKKACKCVPTEKYYTIGYGHYGKDVASDATITKKEAIALLKKDLTSFEKKVDKYNHIYHFTQNEYDALVSFCYNVGNIDKLTVNGRRTKAEIADAMLRYTHSSGKELRGLVRRRTMERELFLSDSCERYYPKYVGTDKNIDVIFRKIGVESKYIGSFSARKPIAKANGIDNYGGTYNENTTLILLAKQGKLKRA